MQMCRCADVQMCRHAEERCRAHSGMASEPASPQSPMADGRSSASSCSPGVLGVPQGAAHDAMQPRANHLPGFWCVCATMTPPSHAPPTATSREWPPLQHGGARLPAPVAVDPILLLRCHGQLRFFWYRAAEQASQASQASPLACPPARLPVCPPRRLKRARAVKANTAATVPPLPSPPTPPAASGFIDSRVMSASSINRPIQPFNPPAHTPAHTPAPRPLA
jgi:hypothetical protein